MINKIINFSKYTSIKIGGNIEISYIDDESIEKIYPLVGAGNNILISNNVKKAYILSKKFDYIHIKEDKLYIGASTPSGKIVNFCKKNNIKNFEWAYSLPATLGGMIRMNAGVKEYEIFNHLISVKFFNGYVYKKDIPHAYRWTNIDKIVYEAVFEIEKGFSKELVNKFSKFRENQPIIASAGSCFKNPKGSFAGKLIEDVGLKGYRINDVGFSEKHSNFLVNYKNGTFDDAIKLINKAKKVIFDKYKIQLEEEIVIINS